MASPAVPPSLSARAFSLLSLRHSPLKFLGVGFNPSAICGAPVLGSDGSRGYGNTGQSIVDGPGQFNTDFSFGKTTTVGGIREDAQMAFRVEFYNAFNHPQFANPGATFGTANFGVITQTSVAPRLIQFGVKYLF